MLKAVVIRNWSGSFAIGGNWYDPKRDRTYQVSKPARALSFGPVI